MIHGSSKTASSVQRILDRTRNSSRTKPIGGSQVSRPVTSDGTEQTFKSPQHEQQAILSDLQGAFMNAAQKAKLHEVSDDPHITEKLNQVMGALNPALVGGSVLADSKFGVQGESGTNKLKDNLAEANAMPDGTSAIKKMGTALQGTPLGTSANTLADAQKNMDELMANPAMKEKMSQIFNDPDVKAHMSRLNEWNEKHGQSIASPEEAMKDMQNNPLSSEEDKARLMESMCATLRQFADDMLNAAAQASQNASAHAQSCSQIMSQLGQARQAPSLGGYAPHQNYAGGMPSGSGFDTGQFNAGTVGGQTSPGALGNAATMGMGGPNGGMNGGGDRDYLQQQANMLYDPNATEQEKVLAQQAQDQLNRMGPTQDNQSNTIAQQEEQRKAVEQQRLQFDAQRRQQQAQADRQAQQQNAMQARQHNPSSFLPNMRSGGIASSVNRVANNMPPLSSLIRTN